MKKRSIAMWLLIVAASGAIGQGASACGDLSEYYDHSKEGRLSRHSRGSAIDVSEDDTRVVAVNRDAGSITVFEVSYAGTGSLRKVKEVDGVCNDKTTKDLG